MEVISTRRYEARPPADSHASILVDPANSVATVKEEEWETRKKKEITTTRQIETRVKRQVVLEDGEVVVDSGPLVTTNTTEDVEQQEHTTQERRTTGDEPQKVEWPAAKSGAVVQKELNETIVKSREEIEELLETEDRQQLGDITDEAYLQAVRNNRGDLRVALAESKRQLASQQPTGPRVLQHTTRSNKVVDTEKTLERSELKQDGQIVTERKTTVEHEEIKDDELPSEINGRSRDEVDEAREYRKEATQRYAKTRDEEIVDYVQNGERVGREMRFVSETTEAERTGDWPNEPPTAGSLRNRLHKPHGFSPDPPAAAPATAASRKDALTRKPLDLEEEDEARKFETSKWLESHFGSESRSSHGSLEDEPHGPTTSNTSYINVTMKSSCAPRERLEHRSYKKEQQTSSRTNGRESTSPSGYFQGISEWSERYQSTEKQTSHTRARSPQYIMESTRETSRMNGHHPASERNHKETSYSRTYESSRRHQEQRHSPSHERPKADPPSPPLRRKAREQVITTKTERSYTPDRAASPVHVVQRTWESRSRDEREERRNGRTSNGRSSAERSSSHRQRDYSPERTRQRPRTPISRSPSPSPRRAASPHRRDKKDEHSRPSKSPSPSKYKIGESFRKLVGKLRSASSERRNKRPGSSSTSQLTQTDDSSTYLQYNSVDRNVPLGPDYDTDDRPPERPPRSPRTVTAPPPVHREIKTSSSSQSKYRSSPRSASPRHAEYKETTRSEQRSEAQPIHRYYLGEDPYGGSIYGKEKGYRETRLHSSRHRGRPIEEEYSAQEPGSLGRFSKSTSRLANEFDQTDSSYHRTVERTSSAQTLPRKIHHHHVSTVNSNNVNNVNNVNSNTISSSSRQQHSATTRRMTNGHSSSPVSRFNSQSQETTSSRPQYGSMINISFRNHVTSPPKTTHFVQTSINTQPPPPPPAPQKPERTYKSTLSRSKSFNVEIADEGVVAAPKTNGFINGYSGGSNVRSSTHLNKLDETPPLKSPGILASISRSNRDLMRNGIKHDY